MQTFVMTETRVDNRPTKEIFPNAVGIIEYAFTLKGVDYFQFSDYNSMANDRAFNALAFYKELSMSCSRDYLLSFSKALDDILNNPKQVLITEIVRLNLQLKERLDLLFEPDIAYKLCSVVFFDASENPNRFEFKHALKKAKIFKEAPIADFFLARPVVQLLPFISSLSKDFLQYCQIVNAINQKHIDSISTMLSEESKREEFYKRLLSQRPKDLASMKQEI